MLKNIFIWTVIFLHRTKINRRILLNFQEWLLRENIGNSSNILETFKETQAIHIVVPGIFFIP